MENSIEKIFVPFEIAQMYKEIGFDELCLAFWDNGLIHPCVQEVSTCSIITQNEHDYKEYDKDDTVFIDFKPIGNDILAPTHQQLIDFLREEHLLHITIEKDIAWSWYVQDFKDSDKSCSNSEADCQPTYYEAYNMALINAAKMIKK